MTSSRFTRREALMMGACALVSVGGGFSHAGALLAPPLSSPSARVPLPNASWSNLPRWRGFNLLEKFTLAGNAPYREEDFQNISDLGFNFVRLPMDYRIWTKGDDASQFNEEALSEIDQVVDYGQKYGVHVQINFHRAPGYTVNTPPEKKNIWKDDDILEICRLHWQTFAKRYFGVSSSNLSFNLFNEPARCEEKDYYRVVKYVVEGIRKEDPERLVVCDGVNWGASPCPSLKNLKVAQATRGYAPMEISHWKAGWIDSSGFPEPQWPSSSFNGLLPSITKREMPEETRKPLELTGTFRNIQELRFTIGTVSNSAELVVRMNGKETFHRTFVSGSGQGEWKKSVYNEEYKIYANIFDLEFSAPVPEGVEKIEFSTIGGDWLTITNISLVSKDGDMTTATGMPDWNSRNQTRLRYDDEKKIISGGVTRDRAWFLEERVKPWLELQKTGVGVMVGEFGAYNKTPHRVVLDWMEDMLSAWKDVGWGWALWNFRGSFGVAESERADVSYQEWRGLKMDSQMLALLQRY